MRDGKVHHHANPFAAMSFHCLLSVLKVLLGGHSRVLGYFGVFLRCLGVNALWVNVNFLSLKGEMEKLIIICQSICCYVVLCLMSVQKVLWRVIGHRGFAVYICCVDFHPY